MFHVPSPKFINSCLLSLVSCLKFHVSCFTRYSRYSLFVIRYSNLKPQASRSRFNVQGLTCHPSISLILVSCLLSLVSCPSSLIPKHSWLKAQVQIQVQVQVQKVFSLNCLKIESIENIKRATAGRGRSGNHGKATDQ